MTVHTPTPWKVVSREQYNHSKITISGKDYEGARFQPIASIEAGNSNALHLVIDEQTQQANAAFIVRACNSHADLVAALEFIATDCPTSLHANRARAALAKAKGE
jgi:hypothetical protein